MQGTTFVGLDVHKPWINVAALLPGHDTPIEWRIANETQAIRKMLERVASLAAGDVRYCYEAGPCGYALQRQIILERGQLHARGSLAHPTQARRAHQDRSP